MSPRRKHIPLMVKLHAALHQLGYEPHAVQLDHDPALALRPIDPETGDTIPPANDPKALIWRPIAEHKIKTFGTPATTAGSDIHKIAKRKRLAKGHAEFKAMVAEKPALIGVEPAPAPRKKKTSGFPKSPRQSPTRTPEKLAHLPRRTFT